MSAWGLARQWGAVGHHSATRLAWEWLETGNGAQLPEDDQRLIRRTLGELDDALHELDAGIYLRALSSEDATRPTGDKE